MLSLYGANVRGLSSWYFNAHADVCYVCEMAGLCNELSVSVDPLKCVMCVCKPHLYWLSF